MRAAQAYATILRYAVRGRGTFVALVALIAAGTAVPVGSARAAGELVEALARGRVGTSVAPTFAVLAGFLVVAEVLPRAVAVMSHALQIRLDDAAKTEMVDSLVAGAGIEHLEGAEDRNKIFTALAGTNGVTVGGAATVALNNLLLLGQGALLLGEIIRISDVRVSAAVIAATVGARIVNSKLATRLNDDWRQVMPLLRRYGYFQRIATEPGPAVREGRVLGLGDPLTEKRLSAADTAYATLWRGRRQRLPLGIGIHALQAVAVAFVIFAIAGGANEGPGNITTVVLAMAGVFTALAPVGGDGQILAGSRSVADCDALIAAGSRRHESDLRSEKETGGLRTSPGDDLVFDEVSFTYPNAERSAVGDVSFRFRLGDSLAIVGTNGAGKSTVIKLLSRLYTPSAGRILWGGVDACATSTQAWRENLTVVFQDVPQYPITIRQFLDLRGESPDEDVHDVLMQVDLAERLLHLPLGLEAVVGRQFPGGVVLSAGEFQRLALARAFLRARVRPCILVLDEPAAHLDPEAERSLVEAVAARPPGLGLIITSHRFTTLRSIDDIVVMDRGSVIDRGSHDDLIRRCRLYTEMYQSQSELYQGRTT